jgi:hypothetical protein
MEGVFNGFGDLWVGYSNSIGRFTINYLEPLEINYELK